MFKIIYRSTFCFNCFKFSLPDYVMKRKFNQIEYTFTELQSLSNFYDIDTSREKGSDLTQSYIKTPYNHRKLQKATTHNKKATNKFDYTTIADRLRTVSLSDDIHPIGVVKLVAGSKHSHLRQEWSKYSLETLNDLIGTSFFVVS